MSNVVTSKLSIRDFTRNIYEYIKREGEYQITIRDSIQFVVTIRPFNQISTDKTEEITPNVMTTSEIEHKTKKEVPIVVTTAEHENAQKHGVIQNDVTTPKTYGCGCEKGSTNLCPKHHRL